MTLAWTLMIAGGLLTIVGVWDRRACRDDRPLVWVPPKWALLWGDRKETR